MATLSVGPHTPLDGDHIHPIWKIAIFAFLIRVVCGVLARSHRLHFMAVYSFRFEMKWFCFFSPCVCVCACVGKESDRKVILEKKIDKYFMIPMYLQNHLARPFRFRVNLFCIREKEMLKMLTFQYEMYNTWNGMLLLIKNDNLLFFLPYRNVDWLIVVIHLSQGTPLAHLQRNARHLFSQVSSNLCSSIGHTNWAKIIHYMPKPIASSFR